MPGLITHYICGEAVKNKLEAASGIITEHRQLYNIGTQGPDIFFYYLTGLLGKRTCGLGSKMHNGGFQTFFSALAAGIRELSGEERDAAFAYACGYLTHYALDCAAHPYIYYKTGHREKGKPIKSLKYSAYHRSFETSIDVLLLNAFFGKRPNEEKLWRLIKTSKPKGIKTAGIIAKAINAGYSVDISGRKVYNAMRYMSNLTRVMQSRGGKRKKLLEWAEGVTIREKLYSSLIHPQTVTDGIDYLNLGKRPWLLPWDKDTESTSDFLEIMDAGISDSIEMIHVFEEYIQCRAELPALLAVLGNRSFATGVDVSQKIDFRYYEIVYEA